VIFRGFSSAVIHDDVTIRQAGFHKIPALPIRERREADSKAWPESDSWRNSPTTGRPMPPSQDKIASFA
jgi:hypothetical protein